MNAVNNTLSPDQESVEIRPNYYKAEGSKEIIDLIRDMPFSLGNAIKYIYRCRTKENKVKDLNKALWYVQDHKRNGSQCEMTNLRKYTAISASEMESLLVHSDRFEHHTIFRIYREWLTFGDFEAPVSMIKDELEKEAESEQDFKITS